MAEFRWSREPNEQTATYLGRVLDDLDLAEMAERARLGHFDDFFAPLEVADGFELHRLVAELTEVAKSPQCGAARRKTIRAVIEKVKTGEFDGTADESARWAASKDGQDAFSELVKGRRG
jgi:hypothetical protein